MNRISMRIIGATAMLASIAVGQPVTMNTPAPELTGRTWINTAGGQPIRLAARHGKVTVVEFWTFGCINCRHNLPAYARWHTQFAPRDVEIIGIHSPETAEEHVTANVVAAVKQLGIQYPVLVDDDMSNWRRWNQQFWPAVYLIDKNGRVRYRWEGELNYGGAGGENRMAALIEMLLKE